MLKQLGERLFTFYCHPDFQEDIKGDLEEYYLFNKEEKGEKYAQRKYLIDVILLFRISLLRNNWLTQYIATTMIKNNVKVAYRSMMRHKFYTALNLVGLAISMAACVFIAIYVKEQMSYDKHFENSEKTYRIAAHLFFGDNEFHIPAAPDPMAKTLVEEFPEVEVAARTRGNFSQLLSVDENYIRQSGITWADQDFFSVFSIPLLYGDRQHLLDEPNTTVLTSAVALKFFNTEDVVGRTIRLNDELDLKITGVVADLPDNTHFEYEMFVSMLNRDDAKQNFWLSNNFITYVRLQDGATAEAFHDKIPDFLLKHMGPQVQQFMGASMKEGIEAGALSVDYYLQPLEDIYLHSNLEFELKPGGSIEYIYIFSIIGFFILLIACINFMNMATARAGVRAKEVGVRKVLGSLRKQLITQFLTESLLHSFISFAVAIGLVYLLLPTFNDITDKQLTNPVFGPGGLWPFLLIACFIVGVLAGIYPAFVLSAFRPVKVLKGELSQGKGTSWMRNILVVIQFVTSIFLIIGSIFIYSQLDYLQTKELGFNKDQVLIINETQLLGDQIEAFKTELLRQPVFEAASISGFIPSTDTNNDFPFLRSDATSPDEAISLQHWYVDTDYADTYGLEIKEGRFFSKEFASDSTAVIMNETALRRFGYEDDPIGKQIKSLGGVLNNGESHYTIVGVMKDFHFKSMMDVIQPQVLILRNSPGAVNLRFQPEKTREAIEAAEAIWDRFSGGKPFDYMFMDDVFANSFEDQNRVKSIFSIFAVLAIVVACLGLFALAAFVTEQRKKEIGIRKVLGASSFSLVKLLFQNFTLLVAIAAVIAMPLAWWYVSGWLADFPFSISMNPLIFILGGAGALLVAWLTVGFQSLKAARRNPVDNLRYE